jgi:hypothetical protein
MLPLHLDPVGMAAANIRWTMKLRQLIPSLVAVSCFAQSARQDAMPTLKPTSAGAARWQIKSSADGWQLLHDGQPFYIRGAVAPNRFDVLKACGGNAVRINAGQKTLDAARAAGLAVMANLPVRGERNQLDRDSAQQVAEQREKVLAIVRELKDHPALMFWSVGNELDHIPGNEPYNPQVWARLKDLAVAIKQLDPHHPVMTVVGTGHYERKVQEIVAGCKDMDLLGINAYGDLQRACELTRKHWPKAYALTEWGPTGHWETPKTKWREPLEQTSSEKAKVIEERYRNIILADRTHGLGSFVFYWSEKLETTHTWYGLFCNGLRTESIDVMQRLWTGAWPTNCAPTIQSIGIEGLSSVRSTEPKAAQTYRVEAKATDPDGDALTFAWDIRPEVVIPPGSYAGSLEKPAQPIPGLIPNPAAATVEFNAPVKPGAYRLFVTITDGPGHIAYGNLPFFVSE